MLVVLGLLVSASSFSQVNQQWARRYNNLDGGYKSDFAQAIAVDASGNVYVTGVSESSETGNDYGTVKYDAAGNQVWTRRYSGPLNRSDEARDVAVDASGNVYVTGSSDDETNESNFDDHDVTTVKYDSAGNQIWVRRYDAAENDVEGGEGGNAVAVDAAGNVYVAGYSSGGFDTYVVVKYDAAGNELWARNYNAGNGDAIATALVVDASGNVHVTGQSATEGYTETQYSTIKYKTDGTQLWARSYSNADKDPAQAYALAVDASGNVYVTGDIGTVKYNAAGTRLWAASSAGEDVAVDASGNVYVVGSGGTIKYNAAGTELWRKFVRSLARSLVALDGLGNVYVAESNPNGGGSDPDITDFDLATRKYNASGTQLWVQYYNGPSDSYDAAAGLVVDASGNVYVTGYSEDAETGYDYITVKYSQTGLPQAVSSFTLINADNNNDIGELKDGDTIRFTEAAPRITMRANTNPGVVGSVLFRLDGPIRRRHLENNAVYSLFANKKTNYFGKVFPTGNYMLTATPFSAAKARGSQGTSLIIRFNIINTQAGNTTAVTSHTSFDTSISEGKNSGSLAVVPNPFSSRAMIRFTVPGSGYATVEVCNAAGVVVERLYQAWAEGGKTYQVPLERKQLKAGVYLLKVVGNSHAQSSKLVLMQ